MKGQHACSSSSVLHKLYGNMGTNFATATSIFLSANILLFYIDDDRECVGKWKSEIQNGGFENAIFTILGWHTRKQRNYNGGTNVFGVQQYMKTSVGYVGRLDKCEVDEGGLQPDVGEKCRIPHLL